MGSYADCWLGGMPVQSTKNEINPDLISLFRASDKVVLAPPIPNLPSHFQHYRESLEEDSDLRIIYYEAAVDVVRDRLDVMGYNASTSKQVFQEWLLGKLKYTTEMMKDWESRDTDHEVKDSLIKHYRNEITILSALTPESWMEGLKIIHTSGLRPSYHSRYEGPHKDTLIGYMLSNDWYGFPGYDICAPLRLAIETCATGERLIYDLTDLVWDGVFDYDEDFVEYGLDIFATAYNANAKTIVLTEGKTDAWILEKSLGILYPHLQDYFSFLDFEVTSIGGGVGNLAIMIKAFAGAGIINNTIALFDNDTAARAACKTLEQLTLPSNIVIRRLPELDFLRDYPTIGPSGEAKLDVNGIAASIELYLGEDVLKIDGAHLTPVQWTGYDRGMKQYQGEVLNKAELQERFRRKIETWNGSLGDEWAGLRAILEMIFSAFDERNRNIICKRIRDFYAS